MKERLFHFKHFAVRHELSAMKVGVDAVLLGAWVNINGCQKVLDVGTGCGVIALSVAQRCAEAEIIAIDVHNPSVIEASANFEASAWSSRLHAIDADFSKWIIDAIDFDLIVSNPPFFDSGVNADKNDRLKARHISELSPSSLLISGSKHLTKNGRIALICPAWDCDVLLNAADIAGLHLQRSMLVHSRQGAAPKRILAEFGIQKPQMGPKQSNITIEISPNEYTTEYKELTHDFYLRF